VSGREGSSVLIAVQAFVASAALLLGACASDHTGDFGRRKEGLITGTVLPKTGLMAAWWRGEPVSLNPFTDDEIELRDRAWRFLMPASDKANLQMKLAELSYTRVLPPIPHSGRNHYHLLLMTEDYRSVSSRYQRIGSDVEADRLLMVPFSQIAARVCAADRMRVQSLNHVAALNPTQREQALARVIENRALVDWVRRDMRERAGAYRYALEHLTVEAPMPQAIRAEQALVALEGAQQTLDYWDGCGGAGVALPPSRITAHGTQPAPGTVRERYAPASPPDIVDKRGIIGARPPK
jgi:hypothetical protein